MRKSMLAKRDGRCCKGNCYTPIEIGTPIIYDTYHHTAEHRDCSAALRKVEERREYEADMEAFYKIKSIIIASFLSAGKKVETPHKIAEKKLPIEWDFLSFVTWLDVIPGECYYLHKHSGMTQGVYRLETINDEWLSILQKVSSRAPWFGRK